MAVFLVLPLPVDVREMQRVLTIAAHPAPRLQTLKPTLQFRVIVVMRASRRGGEINSDEGSEEFHAVCRSFGTSSFSKHSLRWPAFQRVFGRCNPFSRF